MKEFKKSKNLLLKCIELGNKSITVLENLSKIYLLTKTLKKQRFI